MVPASPPAQPPAPQPWHLIAIKLAAEGQHPATIRLHPDMPDNITGRQIADFLKQHLQEAAGNGSQHPAA